MTVPYEKQTDLESYLAANTPQALLPRQLNYWSNYPKLFVSMMKSCYGDKAQKENGWGFNWPSKWDKSYDVLQYFDMIS